jgi:hypothetical protein
MIDNFLLITLISIVGGIRIWRFMRDIDHNFAIVATRMEEMGARLDRMEGESP